MTCGATKPHDRLVPPLVCNLPAGHSGPHGIRANEWLPPFVTWEE